MVREVRVSWDDDDGIETKFRRGGEPSLRDVSPDWDEDDDLEPVRPPRKAATAKRHLAGADWLNWKPPQLASHPQPTADDKR